MDTPLVLLQAVYQALQEQFGLGPAPGPPVTPAQDGADGLQAYQIVDTRAGQVCLEVHYTFADTEKDGTGGEPEIWVCVPRPGIEGIPSGGYSWFRYHRMPENGRILPDCGPRQICPPYAPWPSTGADAGGEPQLPLADDGDWAHRQRYLIKQVLFQGADPPHWSPILVLTDEPEPFIGAIHAQMQHPATRLAARGLLDQARPDAHVRLAKRVMNNWQPVTLRGLALRASFTQNDFALDHAVGYIKESNEGVRKVPNGHLWEGDARDPDWPGLDWHIDILPDPDVRYLASPGDPERIAVEIEHFALPIAYRPQRGEWIQIVGRWVIDCGHLATGHSAADGFLTEIHPSELLVSSRPDTEHGHGTVARVLVTGAWQGFPLDFVVFPPPRPSAGAKLRWSVTDELCKRTTLTVTQWPANANHLVCTLETDDDTSLLVQPNGLVGMTDTRGYHAIITCWWEVPSAQVTGVLAQNDGQPVQGSFVFYRAALEASTPWSHVAVDEAGAYIIPALAPGAYWVRPAGSAWDFVGVPQRIELAAGTQELSFTATPAEPVESIIMDDLSSYPLHREETWDWHELLHTDGRGVPGPDQPLTLQSWTFDRRLLQLDPATHENPAAAVTGEHLDHLYLASRIGQELEVRQAAVPSAPLDDTAVAGALADAVLTVISPPSPFGVRENGLGYADTARLSVYLARLDDSRGRPIQEAEGAVSRVRIEELDANGSAQISHDVVQIHGVAGPGLQGATICARLWLADQEDGGSPSRVIDEATGETDTDGLARFDLLAGTHVAEVVLTLEVVSNPANPWLLPRVQLPSYLFTPAGSADDSLPAKPYAIHFAVASEEGPDGAQENKLRRLDAKRTYTRETLQSLGPDGYAMVLDYLATALEIGRPDQFAGGPKGGGADDITQIETVTRSTFPRAADQVPLAPWGPETRDQGSGLRG